jgi:hypothetical protein
MLKQLFKLISDQLFATLLFCATAIVQLPLNAQSAIPPVLFSTSCNNLDFTSGTPAGMGSGVMYQKQPITIHQHLLYLQRLEW